MNELDELRLQIAKAKGWSVEERLCEWNADDTVRIESQSVLEQYPYQFDEAFISTEIDDGALHKYPCRYQGTKWKPVPDWPRDIAAAWELVEEMRNEYEVYITAAGVYTCNVMRDDVKDAPYESHSISYICSYNAPTAPEAICRAWLAWKEARP